MNNQTIEHVISLAERARPKVEQHQIAAEDDWGIDPPAFDWDREPNTPEIRALGACVRALSDHDRFLLQALLHLGRMQVYEDGWQPDQEWLGETYTYMQQFCGDADDTACRMQSLVNELPRFLRRAKTRLAEGGLGLEHIADEMSC